MNVLRVKSGTNPGKVYDIASESLTLGRDVPADSAKNEENIQVLDQGVSRKHAEIVRIGEMYFIRDLESRNGTFVNDEAVSEVVLRIGDQIRIGNTILVFEDHGSRLFDSRRVLIEDAVAKQRPAAPSATIQFTRTVTELTRGRKEKAPTKETNLEILFGISHIIAEEKNLSKILTGTAELIGTALDADNVFVFSLKTPGEPDSEFDLRARFDRSGDVEDSGVSRSIIGDCLQHSRSVLTSDAGLDARFSAMASVVMRGIKSVICVPIASLGKNLGFLYISNGHKAEAFTAENLELASAIGIQLGITMQLLRMVHDSDQFFRNSVRTLVSAIEMRDPATKGSADRVATYCMAMATELGSDTKGIRDAWLAGMLHDIGSIPLSDQDRDATFLRDSKKTYYARELLKGISGMEDVMPGILMQGERWDGSGTPESKKGEEIPPLARILGLSCEFDQLLHQGGEDGTMLSIKEALVKMRDSADRLFDRETINALLIAYRNGNLFNQEAAFFAIPTGE